METVEVERYQSCSFPAHYHAGIEIFLLEKGHYTLTINGVNYEATNGCVAVSDSFDVHAYKKHEEKQTSCVLIVPYSYLQRFNFWRKNLRFQTHVLHDSKLCKELLKIVDAYLVCPTSQFSQETATELLLARILEKFPLIEEKRKKEDVLIREILAYLQEHFTEKISREKVAKALGYTPEHVSRVFHKYFEISLASYVNGLRMAYIQRRRKIGDTRPTVDLIYEAGFSSQQTYYRFKNGKSE